MCSAALSTWAASEQLDCRLYAITRKKIPNTMLSTALSRCMK
jgi:hypothetical protein